MFRSRTCYKRLCKFVTSLVCFLVLHALTATAQEAVKIDQNIQSYNKVSDVSGKITSVGSDTMNHLMTLWCLAFNRYYPDVKCQIEGTGSSTALPALIEGRAQFGPMSREMQSVEVDQFVKTFGYQPTALETAMDTIAIYVNKDNPIDCLTIEQVDAIYSKANKCGAEVTIKTWGQAGLPGDWAHRTINLYGRNSESGTYGFFKEHALCEGDFKDRVKERPGSTSVVQGITEDRYGIGYGGIEFVTSGVKAIKVAKTAGQCAEPNLENALAGSYPLGRYLYLYVNKPPNMELDRLRAEFIKFVLSKEGQEVAVNEGYMAVPAKVGEDNLRKIVSKGDSPNIMADN